MAQVDTGIYANLLRPGPSALDYAAEADKRETNQLALQQGRMNLLSAQRSADDEQALRGLYSQEGFDPYSDSGVSAALRISPQAGLSAIKGRNEAAKAKADLAHVQAQTTSQQANAQKDTVAAAGDKLKQFRSALDYVDTPDGAARWLKAQYDDPLTAGQMNALGPYEEAVKRIPRDPGQFQQWRQKAGLGMEKHLEVLQKQATQAETVRHNQATESDTRRGQDITDKRERQIAGVGAGGEPSASVEAMAQMIAAGKAAPISGFALARPQGQAVMARVAAINPAYDATEYGAKAKAAKDFGTGQQGNSMRSFAVAGQHLDQLNDLVDALNNKDLQLVNKIGNKIAEQTGSPAPTNFEAAKEVVSKEVIKAIVAGGGGVSEREELARLMSSANSPKQLKGVINQYRSLMAAQHEALLTQRRAAGLSDSTLPNYDQGGSKLMRDADAILKGQ